MLYFVTTNLSIIFFLYVWPFLVVVDYLKHHPYLRLFHQISFLWQCWLHKTEISVNKGYMRITYSVILCTSTLSVWELTTTNSETVVELSLRKPPKPRVNVRDFNQVVLIDLFSLEFIAWIKPTNKEAKPKEEKNVDSDRTMQMNLADGTTIARLRYSFSCCYLSESPCYLRIN